MLRRTELAWRAARGEALATREIEGLNVFRSFVARCAEPAVFVFKDFHVLFGMEKREQDHTVVRKLRDLLPVLKNSAKPKNVVFLSPVVKIPLDPR